LGANTLFLILTQGGNGKVMFPGREEGENEQIIISIESKESEMKEKRKR